MNRITSAQVAGKLSEDGPLVQERIRFAHEINTPAGFLSQRETLFTMGNTTAYVFFSGLLDNWIGREASSVTIGKLLHALQVLNLKSAAESVRSLAAPDSTVILPTGTAGSSAGLPTPTPMPMPTTTNFTDILMRKKVAKILVEDQQLLRTWEDFSALLGVPPHETMSWKRQYANDILTATALLDNILMFWISRNGKKASVNALCDILVTGEYEMLAGRLKDEFNITQ